MIDERHILVMTDGTEWLRDPRFDSEQRLKDMPQEMADDFRRLLPIRHEGVGPSYNPAIVHVFPEALGDDWDGSESDPQSRFTAALQLHFHGASGGESVTMVHLTGIAVHQDDDGIQQVDDEMFAEDLDLLTQLYEPDHPYYTATLDNGRNYVVFGVPYC